jgi:hypothetical protein
MAEEYYNYAFAVLLMTIVSMVVSLIDTRNAIENIREMAKFKMTVNVFNKNLKLEKF